MPCFLPLPPLLYCWHSPEAISRSKPLVPKMKRIAILGSTGSIGHSTLKIAEAYPDRFQVVTLAAGSNVDTAFEQCVRWKPKVVSVAAETDAARLKQRFREKGIEGTEVVYGQDGTVKVATH